MRNNWVTYAVLALEDLITHFFTLKYIYILLLTYSVKLSVSSIICLFLPWKHCFVTVPSIDAVITWFASESINFIAWIEPPGPIWKMNVFHSYLYANENITSFSYTKLWNQFITPWMKKSLLTLLLFHSMMSPPLEPTTTRWGCEGCHSTAVQRLSNGLAVLNSCISCISPVMGLSFCIISKIYCETTKWRELRTISIHKSSIV